MSRSRKNNLPDEAYKSWIRLQPCVVCEKLNLSLFLRRFAKSEAHHAGHRGLSQTAPDKTCIPLCWRHHDRRSPVSVHSLGKKFWVRFGLDRNEVIREYNERYEQEKGIAA